MLSCRHVFVKIFNGVIFFNRNKLFYTFVKALILQPYCVNTFAVVVQSSLTDLFMINKTNLFSALSPCQPGFAGTRISQKYTSPSLHFHRVITMRLFTSYQLPPFLRSSASDAHRCKQFKPLSTTSLQVFLGLSLGRALSTS